MTHYKVEVIQKHIETYVVEADSKQEAEKLTYEGMHDWLDPSSSKRSKQCFVSSNTFIGCQPP